MRAFAEQVHVDVAEDRPEAIGIFDLGDAFADRQPQAVVERAGALAGRPREESRFVDARQIRNHRTVGRVDRDHARGLRNERADRDDVAFRFRVRAEDRERIAVLAADDGRDGGASEHRRARAVPCR